MSLLKFAVFPIMLILLSSYLFGFRAFSQVNEREAATALTNAQETVISAYQDVLKAEKAGANVTDLCAQLSQAGNDLARAQMEFELGHFDDAADFATSSQNTAQDVRNTAAQLEGSALNAGFQRMVFTVMATVAALTAISLGSLWSWHFLKKRYKSNPK